MNEIPTTVKGCLSRLRDTTVVSNDLKQDRYAGHSYNITLRDNGNRYHISFMKGPTGDFTIVPNENTCRPRPLPVPKGSKNLPDAIRRFAEELNIKDPNHLLKTRKERQKLLGR